MQFHRGVTLRIIPLIALPLLILIFAALSASAQSGNAGTIRGTVTDPSGAVVPNAMVRLANPVSEFDRATTSDATGQFSISNVPFNLYSISVTAKGFSPLSQNVELRSSVGITVKLVLRISGGSQTVTVQAAGDLVENDPTFHVDVGRSLFATVPLESQYL